MSTERNNTAINVPNILTLVRLLLTPPFVILLLQDKPTMALMVFTLAGISDALDGWIARCFNQRTVLGAYLDPVADKVLLSSAFICLSILGIIPAWLTVIVLSRDILIIIGIAVLTLTEKKFRMRPSILSKCTTTVQIFTVMISLLVSNLSGFAPVQYLFVWLTAVFTTLSGLNYIYVGMNIYQHGESTQL